MYMTEKEAKRMVCPMTFNNSAPNNSFECVASKCMAWRWQMWLFCLDKNRFLNPGESTTESRSEMRPIGRGYCGLAGRPE